jgi:large subunit ribosomal protein L24
MNMKRETKLRAKIKVKSHVKIGDKIKIISGDQKGFIGTITSIFRKKSTATIEGVLPRIKYIKNKEGGESIKTELPILIHLSNLMLWDSVANLTSKIGYKIISNEKIRYFKKSGNILEKMNKNE